MTNEEIIIALQMSNSMLESLAVQLKSWGIDPVVNWRYQVKINEKLFKELNHNYIDSRD